MTAPFHGRRILVTGAAKGIGLATLVRLAAEGARLAALDRDAAALAALPARLGAALGHAGAVDVADGAAVGDAVKASAAALGGLDGVVNAAGVDLYADIEAMASADWDRDPGGQPHGAVSRDSGRLPFFESGWRRDDRQRLLGGGAFAA